MNRLVGSRGSILPVATLAAFALSGCVSGQSLRDCQTAITHGQFDEARRLAADLEERGSVPRKQLDEVRTIIGHRVWRVQYNLRVDQLRSHTLERFHARGGYVEYYCFRDTSYQRITDFESKDRMEFFSDSAGNKVVRVWPGSDGVASLAFRLVQTPQAHKIGTSFPTEDSLPADVVPYLRPTKKIDSESKVARDLAAELRQPTLDATVRRTLAWWMSAFKLGDVSPGGGPSGPRTTATVSLLERTGYCWGQSKAVTAVLRAMGIPARNLMVLNIRAQTAEQVAMGIPPSHLPLVAGDPLTTPVFAGYHAAVEYYDPTNGWLAMDGNLDPSKSVLHWAPLSAELTAEQDPFGTTIKSYYGMYNEGGNHVETLRNVRVTLESTQFKVNGK